MFKSSYFSLLTLDLFKQIFFVLNLLAKSYLGLIHNLHPFYPTHWVLLPLYWFVNQPEHLLILPSKNFIEYPWFLLNYKCLPPIHVEVIPTINKEVFKVCMIKQIVIYLNLRYYSVAWVVKNLREICSLEREDDEVVVATLKINDLPYSLLWQG